MFFLDSGSAFFVAALVPRRKKEVGRLVRLLIIVSILVTVMALVPPVVRRGHRSGSFVVSCFFS